MIDLGIIGLARSGKTTVFNALTQGHARTGSYGAAETNIGVVKVPDSRLDELAARIRPKRLVPAEVRYLDFPATGTAFSEGGPGGAFLAALGSTDALIHVVRAFVNEAVPHPQTTIDPHRDIATMEAELIFADLAIIERRLDRLTTVVRSARAGEAEAARHEMALLQCVKAGLEAETPVRAQDLSDEERQMLSGYNLLSAKPLLILVNIGEEDTARATAIEAEFRERYRWPRTEVVALAGRLEMELAELSDEEAAQFRADFALPPQPGRQRVISLSYSLLGLISFFTFNADEGHAWSVPAGTTAVRAAGKIHSDMERGFIRAEVLSWQEMLRYGSWAEARKHGALRTEGKSYQVQDGDVIHILFNV